MLTSSEIGNDYFPCDLVSSFNICTESISSPVLIRMYTNMIQMIRNNIIPSELGQAKLTLIVKDSFGIRCVHNLTGVIR